MSIYKKILVTGGAGFIGSNFIHLALKSLPNTHIVNLDKLTYAGNLRNLEAIKKNYTFVKGDILDSSLVQNLIPQCDTVVHFAAESHVDRSILDAVSFIETNVKGTLVLLEAIKKINPQCRFVHVSTDEVYGSLSEQDAAFTEQTNLAPNSPYSASKAGSDLLVRSYVHTHQLDAITTRCSNNYGPYQFPEKLIPLMITNALENKPLPVYGEGKNIRDWIYVTDHCEGLLLALEKGKSGEVYNFGGDIQKNNIDVVKNILKILNKPESLIRFVEDRKGHDWRYDMNNSKAKTQLGWAPSHTFETGLEKTVAWYCKNETWWKEIKTGEYRDFYKKYYGGIG